MSDLISRSELIKHFETIQLQEDAIGIDFVAIIDEIKEQPTAYDIDKIVEELKCDRCESCNFLEVCEGSKCCGKCHEKAIEIVKHGGLSDDVCEWEKGFSGYVGYPAYYSKCCSTKSKGLEMQTHIIADWKYCPYCGKKIKIVGD